MKRIVCLLLALLLTLSVTALAEPYGPFDYTDDILEDGSLIYYFQDLSLTLPADWSGKLMVVRGEQGVSFYQKASYEKYQAEGMEGGLLFSLGASVNDSFTELPHFEYLGFSENSAMNYFLNLPSDFQPYMEGTLPDEYSAMYAEMDFVLEHVEIYPER